METILKKIPDHLHCYGLLSILDLIRVIESRVGMYNERLTRTDIKNLAIILEASMKLKNREIVPKTELVKQPTQILAIEVLPEDESVDDGPIDPEPEPMELSIEPAEPQAWANDYEVFEGPNW